MDNLGYLFAAYLVFWLISFVFILGIAVRQKRLEREVDRLRRAQESKETEELE
ncbi:MAG: CcmD family protein [Anaerolineae bacterium]|jgi:CcmD family protein|nr:CcmD family protein [Anaerolineae bacterium]MDH7474050.1 CcmD family protein [Anaerolineae bacterium]